MQANSKVMNTVAFIKTPFPLIADAVLEEKTDPKTNEQLAELTKVFKADSDVVKPLAALKAAKDDEAREELIRLLKESGEKQMPLLTLGRDDVAMLAAKFGITNKDTMAWKKKRTVEMADEGLITDADIKREVFVDDAGVDALTAKLIKAGMLARDGAGYRTPAAASNQ